MAQSQQKKPNILIMWGDDIGMWNVSRYSHGMMGYRTPNIDRIGQEGATFTDWYGQQSCTAGRASFMPGPKPIRQGRVLRQSRSLERRRRAGTPRLSQGSRIQKTIRPSRRIALRGGR